MEKEATYGGDTMKDYTILKEDRFRQLQENDILEVCSVLCVSRGLACTLLLQKNWNATSVIEQWFDDEESAHEAIGISTKQPPKLENYCKICLETMEIENMFYAACGHIFCADCWKKYFTTSISDGPGCLTLRCPEPKCKAVAGLDMVESLVPVDDKRKYYEYMYRSYVEFSRKRKWCPAPGCEFAVEFDAGGQESYDVTCDCTYKFCWNCREESHRPVDCKKVAKWFEKIDTAFIRSFTKPCPKCGRNIERDSGCNHMTCGAPCRFEFCWICLRPWNSCKDYACKGGNGSSIKKKRVVGRLEYSAKEYLERYKDYHEGWRSYHKSRDTALAILVRLRNEYKMIPHAEVDHQFLLQFVIEAWDQIFECRRILKWTYVYEYYMEVGKLEKKTLFEFLRGEAAAALRRLQDCAEKEMDKYIKTDHLFRDLRGSQLASVTDATRNFFQNLVRTLENDLSEFGSTQACTSTSKAQASNMMISLRK